MTDDHPVPLDVEYPDHPLNRVTTFFRAFTIIPIAIVLGVVSGAETWRWDDAGGATDTSTTLVEGAGGILIAGPLLMILFRQKYPRWWFDWNQALAAEALEIIAVARTVRSLDKLVPVAVPEQLHAVRQQDRPDERRVDQDRGAKTDADLLTWSLPSARIRTRRP